MFNVNYNPNVPEIDHHEFIYLKGKKIPKHDNGLRYPYIDKYGLFHVTKWEDDASKYGKGVYAVTDELSCKDGFPVIDGVTYKIWGADEYAVKLSNDSDERYHTKTEQSNNKVVVPHNDKTKMAACEIIRKMYLALEAKRAEIED